MYMYMFIHIFVYMKKLMYKRPRMPDTAKAIAEVFSRIDHKFDLM